LPENTASWQVRCTANSRFRRKSIPLGVAPRVLGQKSAWTYAGRANANERPYGDGGLPRSGAEKRA